MSSKRVVITVNAKKLVHVLSSLELDSEFSSEINYTLEVGIKDSKKNYELLCQPGFVESWDFEDTEENKNIEPKDVKEESPNLVSDEDDIKELFTFLHPFLVQASISKYSRLMQLFLILWEIKQKSPALRFTIKLFSSYITCANNLCYKRHYELETFNRLVDMLKGEYSYDASFNYCLEDFLQRAKKYWRAKIKFDDPVSALEYLLKN